ncbi:DUF2911 domain-containing protein [Flavobacterium sp.]|uniref:DUF2911 domain-containing protein n=1 Tax=Flavobacterium sp. TaxID=239 RepID=UPI003D11F367
MKNIIKIFCFLTVFSLSAQIKVPQVSPKSVINQTIGLTEVEVEYCRPSAKGRIVFGELVPFGKIWRAGANANTTISFSDDVNVNGVTLKKGKYALYISPKADEWEIFFYSETNNWGTPEKWDETKIALKTTSKTELITKHIETFVIGFNNLDLNTANLELMWEKTFVNLKIEVPTTKTAVANIEKVINGPSASDYFTASQYYFNSNLDLNKALTYVNKAYDLNDKKPYWYTRLKSQILAKLGDFKGAIEVAKTSLESAKLANNSDYIKMNEESIKEWSRK